MTSESAPTPLETEASVRVWMLIAYDGKPFLGFAYQRPEVPTVARELRLPLARMIGYEPEIVVAGRTDAGVHAWGQLIHVELPQRSVDRFGMDRLQLSLNKQMGPHVVVRDLGLAGEDFHARYTPIARRYRYTVYNSPVSNPFMLATSWHVPKPLDIDRMNEASKAILGEHDFTSFCKKRPDAEPEELMIVGDHRPSTSRLPRGHRVRRIHSAEWFRTADDVIRFDVEAKAFCHQMVRSLVGTLVQIGVGKFPVGYMKETLEGRSRVRIPTPAPPEGLCLWEVVLPENTLKP